MEPTSLFLMLMFALLFAGIVGGIPAWLAIGGAPLVTAFLASLAGVFDPVFLTALPQRVFGMMANQLFIAIPLFILMGVLMEKTGLAAGMLQAVEKLGNGSRRQMALSILVISALIAASTGIAGATIVMLSLVSYPALVQSGVPRSVAGGLVVSAGTLGQIIPPSIVLIVLADQISNAWQQAQRAGGNFAIEPVTVSQLFAGALVPGLLLVFFFAIYLFWRLGGRGNLERERGVSHLPVESTMSMLPLLLPLLLPLVLIIAVLGSILLGVATATEAAAIGAFGTLILGITRMGVRDPASLLRVHVAAFQETVYLCGVIFAIILAASVLSLVFRGLGGDEAFAEFAMALPGDKWTALLLVLLIVFLLGFVLEFIEIIFIVVPIAGPVLFAMGIDPVWFAILLALNLQTSFLTPPLGVALFYFRSVVREGMATLDLYRGIVPFICLQLLALLSVLIFPQLALGLPQWLLGN